jgi:hypothetical protein
MRASGQDKLISELMETVVETVAESITTESQASSKSPPRSACGNLSLTSEVEASGRKLLYRLPQLIAA